MDCHCLEKEQMAAVAPVAPETALPAALPGELEVELERELGLRALVLAQKD